MFSRCVMSQFVRLLTGLSFSLIIKLRLFRIGYVTLLLPPNFKPSPKSFCYWRLCGVRYEPLRYIWFVNSWRSLLNWSAAACAVLILELRLVLLASFWQCSLFQSCFRVVSVWTADIRHWELFIFELYQLCVEESSYSEIRQRFVRDGAELM
ncbi:hypothetical protein YC2023_010483 [Brassica napus]